MNGTAVEFMRWIIALSLATVRLLAVFTVMPVLSDQLVTGTARRTVVVALALVVAPLVRSTMPDPQHWSLGFTVVIMTKEVMLGILIGFLGGVPFWIAENVGNFVDNQRGATMGEVYSPLTGSQDSPIGLLLLQLANAFFFTSGGLLAFLGAVYTSYRLWPVFAPFPQLTSGFPLAFLGQADELIRQVVILAGPAVIIMFLATLGLGLINRVVPQMNVFFLSMPIKSALGILILLLYLQYLTALLGDSMRLDILGFMRSVIR